MKHYPMLLAPYVSETIWGGRKLIEQYGVKTEKPNAAEGWMLSCHPAGASTVVNGAFAGRSLADVTAENPTLCGTRAADFSAFPLLIKFIDAQDDLSVQVHPTAEYCRATGRGQSKTECWYIMDCAPDAHLLLGFTREISREEFRAAIETNTLTDLVRKVPVKPGDFFFIEAGTLHAICKGILLAEVQESSNTTYRIYDYDRRGTDGKPRELHVEDALAVTKRAPFTQPEICKGNSLYREEKTLLADCPLFKVWKLQTNGVFTDESRADSFVSLLVLEGGGALTCCGETLQLQKGSSVFLPAGCGSYRLEGSLSLLETRL